MRRVIVFDNKYNNLAIWVWIVRRKLMLILSAV